MKPKKRVGPRKPPPGNELGQFWRHERLYMALRLLASLPSVPCSSIDDMCAELRIKRRRFYLVVKACKCAGFVIKSAFLPEGKKAYFLDRQSQALIQRILRS